jgi:ubiquinone/menaquinone biosynthesis C-methylase UbiE
VSEDEDGIEPRWGEGRPLSLGWPEPLDSLGIRRRLDLLDEIRPLRGGRILDVGCGNGSYTERLTEGFDTVAGVEVEPDRLAEFQRRVSSRPDADRFDLRLETAEALSDPDGSFDAVIAIETLEHVVDDVQAAAEAFRVLRRGGRSTSPCPTAASPSRRTRS